MIQTMLGHKSASQTLDLYGHLFPNELGQVMERSPRRAAALAACRIAECGPWRETAGTDGGEQAIWPAKNDARPGGFEPPTSRLEVCRSIP
jgi:hypothetical protein